MNQCSDAVAFARSRKGKVGEGGDGMWPGGNGDGDGEISYL